MPLHDSDLSGRFQVRHHGQNTCELSHLLKVGTKFGTLVRDQDFHRIVRFEPELSWCGKGFCGCHVLPACSLVEMCTVTNDVHFSLWFFSVERVSHFHRVNAAILVETVTLWQSGSRLGSRHRSCDAIWAVKVTL